MAQKKIVRVSFEEWQKMTERKVTVSLGITFKDGFRGTYCLERRGSVIADIKFLMQEHGEVEYISCLK